MLARLAFVLALTFAIAPNQAAAREATQAEIAEAEASFLKTADEAFVRVWNEKGDQMASDGISATAVRQYTLWGVLPYSLGLCKNMVSASLMADWRIAADRLPFGFGPGADEARARAQREASVLMRQGEVARDYGEPGSPGWRNLCSADLGAIARILRKM